MDLYDTSAPAAAPVADANQSSMWKNPWVIGAAIIVVLGLLWWFFWRSPSKSSSCTNCNNKGSTKKNNTSSSSSAGHASASSRPPPPPAPRPTQYRPDYEDDVFDERSYLAAAFDARTRELPQSRARSPMPQQPPPQQPPHQPQQQQQHQPPARGPPRRTQNVSIDDIDYSQMTGDNMALPVGENDDDMWLEQIHQERMNPGPY